MPKVPSHRHTGYEDRLEALAKGLRNIESAIKRRENPILTIYSADNEVCVEREHNKWHRIVCQYEGDRCIGTPRPHWFSQWEITPTGFTLVGFLNQEWKGWHGQYTTSELRYDELPRDVLKLHVEAMQKHIASLSFWLPCHIFNDISGELYRP